VWCFFFKKKKGGGGGGGGWGGGGGGGWGVGGVGGGGDIPQNIQIVPKSKKNRAARSPAPKSCPNPGRYRICTFTVLGAES